MHLAETFIVTLNVMKTSGVINPHIFNLLQNIGRKASHLRNELQKMK